MQIYANNTTKIHSIIFIFCLVLAIISPQDAIPSVSGSETLTKTGKVETRVVETISHTGETNINKTNG
jgi:hypothetical protein